MTAAAAAPAAARMRRTAFLVVGIVLVAFVGIGVLIAEVSAGIHRPEGAAERWLSAISDTTRKGVQADGRHRAADAGPGVDYQSLLPAAPTGGKAAFSDLEVGRADRTVGGADARVPFELHQHADSGTGPAVNQTVVLHRLAGGRWRVTGLDVRRPGEKVPSQGGAAPSKAPLRDWVGALVLGALLTAGASALVGRAGRASPAFGTPAAP